jgi:hypothetical protein
VRGEVQSDEAAERVAREVRGLEPRLVHRELGRLEDGLERRGTRQ